MIYARIQRAGAGEIISIAGIGSGISCTPQHRWMVDASPVRRSRHYPDLRSISWIFSSRLSLEGTKLTRRPYRRYKQMSHWRTLSTIRINLYIFMREKNNVYPTDSGTPLSATSFITGSLYTAYIVFASLQHMECGNPYI